MEKINLNEAYMLLIKQYRKGSYTEPQIKIYDKESVLYDGNIIVVVYSYVIEGGMRFKDAININLNTIFQDVLKIDEKDFCWNKGK